MICLSTCKPRPYQAECLTALAKAREQGIKKGLVVMASGLGKTLTVIFDIERFLTENPDAHFLYICHQESILLQSKEKFHQFFGEEYSYGMYTGSYKTRRQVTFLFGTFQTLRDHREEFSPDAFDYIVVDEAHHTSAVTYQPTADYFEPQFLIGLTATKDRMDGQDILDTYERVIYQMDIYDGWEQGWLARVDYRIMLDDLNQEEFEKYVGPQAGSEKVSLSQLNRTIFAPQHDEGIVASIREQTADLDHPSIFVFCSSIEHANAMAGYFGGEAAVIHSRQSADLNVAILDRFRSGDLRVVISVNMLNEGIDVPEANVVVFLRSTDSSRIFFQQLGRGLRINGGSRIVRVLDYVANLERISMVLEMEETAKKRIVASPTYSTSTNKPEPIVVNIPATKFKVQRVDVERLLEKAKAGRGWSDEELISAILQQRRILGRTPTMEDMRNNNKLPDPGTYINRFGSWSRALKLCGLTLNKGQWDDLSDEDLLGLIASKSKNGTMPTFDDIKSDPSLPHPSLFRIRFGNWGNIAKRLGLKMTRSQTGFFDKKEKSELCEILQQEAKKLNGKSPSLSYMRAHQELPAPDAFIAVFGSWNAALRAAGLSVNQATISDEDMLVALRLKAKAIGRTPTRADVSQDSEMPSAVSYANRFGSFLEALKLAGLTYGNRSGWKRDPDSQQVLDLEMLKKLRTFMKQIGHHPTQSEVNNSKDLASAITYKRHFGSFKEAIALAEKLERE